MKSLMFTRINDNFTPKYVIESLVMIKEEIKFIDSGILRLTTFKDEDGLILYSFGLKATGNNVKPGHGGEWSSNSTYVNQIFGVDITEIDLKIDNDKYHPGWWAGYARRRSDISIPDCLEWRMNWGSIRLMPKEGVEFPRGTNYFMSTSLDANGVLIYPLSKVNV